MIKIEHFDRFDADLRRGGQNLRFRMFKYGIDAIYGHKPFWLMPHLAGCTQSGHVGCPKLRNLGCG